jgi:hypothetical protein
VSSDIEAILKRLAAENGGVLTAQDVVSAAEPEDSPLHPCFEWDDSAAAEAWRLHQARNLILRVTVDVPVGAGETMQVRAWASLTPDRQKNGGGYREIVRVMKNADMRSQLLQDAKTEMEQFCSKYASLSELAEVFAAMRKARAA